MVREVAALSSDRTFRESYPGLLSRGMGDDRKRRGRPATTLPDIGLAGLKTTPERYQRLLEAAPQMTAGDLRAYLDAVMSGVRIVDLPILAKLAKEAEQRSLEAERLAKARTLSLPASRTTVEVPDISADIASGWQP